MVIEEPYDPSVQHLLALLELERIDRDLFRTAVGGTWRMTRLYGGQVAAQALRAATHTIDVDHVVHSLHGYFLRPGDPTAAVLLHVDRIRDGRSFTTRRVTAVQDGEAIFTLGASFHKDEPSREFQQPAPAGVPRPDDDFPWFESPMSQFGRTGPFDVRELPPARRDERGAIESTRRAWMRVRDPLPDDPALHACLLTFASDLGAVYAAARAVGGKLGHVRGASLDHAVWFHRPVRLDEWVLFDLHPVSNAGSRGLVQGSFVTLDGALVASVAQEALVRLLDD